MLAGSLCGALGKIGDEVSRQALIDRLRDFHSPPEVARQMRGRWVDR